MSTTVEVIPATGRGIVLMQPGNWSRNLAYGGITGLVGSTKRSTEVAVGVPGETVTSHQVEPMSGEMRIFLSASGSETVEDLEAEVRRVFDSQDPSQLILRRRGQVFHTRVLLDGFIDPPVEVLEDAVDAEMRVPLASSVGLWDLPSVVSNNHGQDSVTVMNMGDAFLWPEVILGSGPSTITLPSKTAVVLPRNPDPSMECRLSLDPYTSHEVWRTDSTTQHRHVDEVLSAAAEMLPLGEGVPRRQSREYKVSGSARLSWREQVLDPWR